MSQGNHPYRKQTQTVNIPDHLLPQIFVDQQQRPKGPQELGANGQGQPRANKPYPRVNTSTAVSPAGPEVAPFQSPVLQHYHEQQSQQQQAPYPIDTEYPSRFHPVPQQSQSQPVSPVNQQHQPMVPYQYSPVQQFPVHQQPISPAKQQFSPVKQQFQPVSQHLPGQNPQHPPVQHPQHLPGQHLPGQHPQHPPQQHPYHNGNGVRTASASSLTYRKQNSSQDSFKYSRQNSNGYNDPNQQYNQQFSQQPQPLQHRPIRKPPGNTAPVENRRIVSTPSVPQLAPTNSKFDNRTKSLSSMSQKYQGTYQQPHMQPIQQGQPMKPSHNSKSSVSGSSSSSNSSSNIHHSFSLSSKSRSFTSLSKLSSLSTKKFNSSASSQGKPVDRTVSSGTIASSRTIIQMSKKPSVYPAMLSRVARVFRESIFLTINTKDGLEYHDTFTGKMAVDIICRIIRTNDRNLALLLGRSLDSQKFFHDVTYQHRLRDSIHEVYAFNHIYSDVELYENSIPGSNPDLHWNNGLPSTTSLQSTASNGLTAEQSPISGTGVNGVFTILTDCYSPTCSRNSLCYSIACPRRLEQQARLNMKPQGGLQRAVSRLSLHDQDETKSLWHETVPKSVLDKLDKLEKMRQELIYEFIYTERDYVKDLEFMTDFYIMPLRNPSNNIIPEREREVFIRTVFGGVSDLLRLAKSISEALTRRQQQQKPVIQTIADVFLQFVDKFEPFIQYSGNKVFASFEHERQQQVNMRYASFLDAIEKRPESRKQDLSSFLIKGIQRPARYQLLLGGILKNTQPDSPDYPDLLKAKEEIEKILGKINIQTGESTDRHKIMVLHRLLGKQTLEDKYNFKLSYNNRIIYQVTLNRKRDNEKIDLYLFEHALLLVKHKIQNKREQYKVFEKPIYLPLLFVNSGYDIPTFRTVINSRINGSIMSESKAKVDSINTKLQINFMGLGSQQVHTTLNADDVANQNQVLSQISSQQKKIMAKYDIFSLSKYETRRFTGNNKINCAVPCYGGKKLLYGTDSGVWVSTVRTISITNNEKICSDPTLVISKEYVTQIEVLVEYSKLLVLSDKSLFEFDLSCTDSLDHAKNTRSGRLILSHVSSFKTGICDGKLLVCCIKQGNNHSINIFEPPNPFDKNKNRNKKYDIREITFSSDPISISFLRTRLCIGCTKGFEILSMEDGKKEPILDEADPSLDFATQKEIVNPLAIHRLGKDFLLSYSEFSFLINRNGWRTKHDWGIFWEGNPTNIALFYPYLLSFESNFIEIRDLKTTYLIRALIGENIRFLHSNEHEAMYACEEGGYDVIVSIDFLNLKPKEK